VKEKVRKIRKVRKVKKSSESRVPPGAGSYWLDVRRNLRGIAQCSVCIRLRVCTLMWVYKMCLI
jgi:hypothetical protein